MKTKAKRFSFQWLIPIVLAVLLAAGGAAGGLVLWRSRQNRPVTVYAVSDFAMTNYYGDSSETEGMVTVDGLQTVFLSDTQTVKQILVSEGDAVHAGEALLTYDTTLTEIDLQRKEVQVQQAELALTEAQKELATVRTYRPGVFIPGSVTTITIPGIDAPEEEPWVDDGTLTYLDGDGSKDHPFQYEWKTEYTYTNAFFDQCMRGLDDAYVTFVLLAEMDVSWLPSDGQDDGEEGGGEEGGDEEGGDEEGGSDEEGGDEEGGDEEGSGEEGGDEEGGDEEGSGEEGGSGDSQQPPTAEPESNSSIEGNEETLARSSSTTTSKQDRQPVQISWTMRIQHTDEAGYVWQMTNFQVDPAGEMAGSDALIDQDIGDTLTPLPEEEPFEPIPPQTITDGIKYTAQELAVMVRDAEQKVRELDVALRQAQMEYDKAEQELNNGAVYSTVDGTITNLLDEQTAEATGEPLMKVTAGGGYYVQGVLSELELNSMSAGQTVTLMSWQTGEQVEGEIIEISEYPTTGGYYWGGGNNNVSRYPFTVFVDGSANLQEGEYVYISYSPGAASSGLYLESMFLRSENGRSYVYVAAEDGTLEKRYLSTGKNLWGSYTEIRDGLSVEDYVAFPYGESAREGAPTQPGTMDEFYGW